MTFPRTLPAKLHFTRGNKADAEIFIILERKVSTPRLYGPTPERAAAERELTINTFYFIEREGIKIGTIAYRTTDDGGIYICNLTIDPAHHGQGLARKAMQFVLDETAAAPHHELVTHPENEAALGLYQSLGFAIVSRHENYFGDGEPRVKLVRKI